MLLLASKMESITDHIDLVQLVRNVGSKDVTAARVLEMEISVLNTLKFELETATVPQFIDVYTKRWSAVSLYPLSLCDRVMASLLCNQTLGRVEFYEFRPSLIAIACVYLAWKYVTGKGRDTPLVEISKLLEPFHSTREFYKCVQCIEPIIESKKVKPQAHLS